MPRITTSGRRNPDTPLAQRYHYPPINWLLVGIAIAIAIATAAALIWLAITHS